MTRPGKLCRTRLEISTCDPPRKAVPREIGNFGLRGSVSVRLAGTIAALTCTDCERQHRNVIFLAEGLCSFGDLLGSH